MKGEMIPNLSRPRLVNSPWAPSSFGLIIRSLLLSENLATKFTRHFVKLSITPSSFHPIGHPDLIIGSSSN
jgi:hypothetical protein